MDQRKKHRKVLRASFTKVANELEHSLSNPEAERRLIQVSLNILQQKLENLKQADREIYDALLESDASEEDLLADIEGSDHYERKYNTLSVRCDEILRPQAVEVRSVLSVSGNDDIVQGKRKFKLPVLEFKKFDGTIKDWLPFWSQFKKIHDDLDLDLSDKVEYLIQATVSGSRARQLVDSFPATGNNYAKILDCLKARFGRDDLQIEVYYAAMLFPLIESCFPPDLLRIWQRAPCIDITEGSGESSLENRLKSLMLFLKNEVENEQHISLAVEGFGLGPNKYNREIVKNNKYVNNTKNARPSSMPTATGLANNTSEPRCVFCNNNSHESAKCFKAQRLSVEQKRKTLGDLGACFRCLKIGHISRKCRINVRCIVCSKRHVEIMCPGILEKKPQITEPAFHNSDSNVNTGASQALANSTNTQVFLQTLRIQLDGIGCSKVVRGLIDTGSQKSYILASTASSLGYAPKRKIDLLHGLFGGSQVLRQHNCYDIHLRHDNYACSFEALDQEVICTAVSPVFDGIWSREIGQLGISLSDTSNETPIEVLIGSDVAGRLYTGRRHVLPCGLVAIETFLGWTLMGKIPQEESSARIVTALSLFVNDSSLANLWELETLVTSLVNSDNAPVMNSEEWHLNYFSKYTKTVRMHARILRFLYNIRNKNRKRKGPIAAEEFNLAEQQVLRLVQSECFAVENDKHLSSLDVFKDENSVLRLRSRVSYRKDLELFRYPIVLPSKHPVISQLIFQEHVNSRHVGVQGLISLLLLGRASLNYEDLSTLVCDCESIINSRPITFVANDPNEPTPLTPMMFLRDLTEGGVFDFDEVNRKTLCRRMLYKRKLREELQKRFRSEYLGQLHLLQKRHEGRQISVGEVVLIGNDQGKRIDWPMGRVTELIRGKDDKVRLVKVATRMGQYLRPIQRLYPLECNEPSFFNLASDKPTCPEQMETNHDPAPSTVTGESVEKVVDKSAANPGVIKSRASAEKVVVTRSGREVKSPKRYGV
ncbi:hypothetical protein NQ317_019132 [Molorchus minor]|uniref:CCHC-type domain-containing protein n=1 Tax=Molorchus minor TaxID=1323400 RepID=A0ABQ9JJG2_9CUCU|nr:hypothetical protein NQ317_019132 [Molorchus minor]